jgi:hypothetical protein
MVLVHYRSLSVFSLGGWTPHLPAGLACPAVLVCSSQPFAYGTLTLSRRPSQTVRLSWFFPAGCSAFARHYSRNRLSSSDYLDVSVRPVPSCLAMCSPDRASPCRLAGFPIRTSPVHSAAHASPELFAVYRVLRRHSTPSHSRCALLAFPLEPCLAENANTPLRARLYVFFHSRYPDSFDILDVYHRQVFDLSQTACAPSLLSALRLRCALVNVPEADMVDDHAPRSMPDKQTT